jgi:cytidylate kinase
LIARIAVPFSAVRHAPIVVAVDGPAASGKGTLSRRLACHYSFAHLDTGALYRATGRDVLAAGLDPQDGAAAARMAAALDPETLDDPRLRDEAVGRAASEVAAHGLVRSALLDLQRRFAAKPPGGRLGAVLDGRDIGTVVCPDAAVKFFVVARPEIRARRRVLELRARGDVVDEAAILADLVARDRRDSERTTAPLRPAADAILIDTSDLDADAVFAVAQAVVDPYYFGLRA